MHELKKSHNQLQIPNPITSMTVPFPLDGCDTKQRYHQSPHGSQYSSLEHSLDSTWPKKKQQPLVYWWEKEIMPHHNATLPLCTPPSASSILSQWEECNCVIMLPEQHIFLKLCNCGLRYYYIHSSLWNCKIWLKNSSSWSFRTQTKAPKGGTIPCDHSGFLVTHLRKCRESHLLLHFGVLHLQDGICWFSLTFLQMPRPHVVYPVNEIHL